MIVCVCGCVGAFCICVMQSREIISIHIKMYDVAVRSDLQFFCAFCGERAAALSLHGDASVGVCLSPYCFYFCADQFWIVRIWTFLESKGLCVVIFPPQHTHPSVGETSKPGSKTTDYLLKLKAVGLDSDLYDLSMNQWSVDAALEPEIGFPDIYMFLISAQQLGCLQQGKQRNWE